MHAGEYDAQGTLDQDISCALSGSPRCSWDFRGPEADALARAAER
jgi:hypothetical protein